MPRFIGKVFHIVYDRTLGSFVKPTIECTLCHAQYPLYRQAVECEMEHGREAEKFLSRVNVADCYGTEP